MHTSDRALIAATIDRLMKRHADIGGRKSRLAHRANITRTTLDTALDPQKWATSSSSTYNRIEIALDLPPDALHHVGMHDWAALIEDGVGTELIAWFLT